ncbi:MAG: ATPase, partial [Nonomuraea sp.]|nr:ATPase [Nonomuraea sp.]
GDPIALELVERMADEVTAMARVCVERLGLQATATEVVLGGGVLRARDPLLMKLVRERLAGCLPYAVPVVADLAPIVGAALSGLDQVGAGAEARERLLAQF